MLVIDIVNASHLEDDMAGLLRRSDPRDAQARQEDHGRGKEGARPISAKEK
jgi:hypothetical protein